MAASTAVEGYGSYIEYDSDGAGTYVEVAEVTKIGGPAMEGKEINVSHLRSDFGFEEFVPGMVNAGEVSLELNMTKAVVAALYALYRIKRNWRITFSQGSVWAFTAFIKNFGNEAPFDDKISMTVSVKITGKPTFTAN